MRANQRKTFLFKEEDFELKMSFFQKNLYYFNLMFWTKYPTQTHEILTQKTSNIVL